MTKKIALKSNGNVGNEMEMDKKEGNKQAPKRIALLVRTMSNGYSVDLEREGYMYYDVQSLLEGLFVRIGMGRLETMTKKEIKAMVEATKDGSIVKKLQVEATQHLATIEEQKKEIKELKKKIKELNEDR